MSISIEKVLLNKKLFAPLVFMVIGFALVSVFMPFNKGIEFGGGYAVSYENVDFDSALVEPYLISESTSSDGVTILKLNADLPSESLEIIRAKLGASLLYIENVSPSYGDEMVKDSLLALLYAMIGMTLYIWLKYNFYMAVFTQLALISDVTISLGVSTMFGVELNVLLIGALVTIIGYSVNDSVVTVEAIAQKVRDGIEDPIESALQSVLPRSLITSQSTLLVLLVLMLASYGTDGLFGFALVLSFGVIAGTMSSLVLLPRLLTMVPSSLVLVNKPSVDGDV